MFQIVHALLPLREPSGELFSPWQQPHQPTWLIKQQRGRGGEGAGLCCRCPCTVAVRLLLPSIGRRLLLAIGRRRAAIRLLLCPGWRLLCCLLVTAQREVGGQVVVALRQRDVGRWLGVRPAAVQARQK